MKDSLSPQPVHPANKILYFVAFPGRSLLCIAGPKPPVIQEFDVEMQFNLRVILVIRKVIQGLPVE